MLHPLDLDGVEQCRAMATVQEGHLREPPAEILEALEQDRRAPRRPALREAELEVALRNVDTGPTEPRPRAPEGGTGTSGAVGVEVARRRDHRASEARQGAPARVAASALAVARGGQGRA
jgi:hypothetical protein